MPERWDDPADYAGFFATQRANRTAPLCDDPDFYMHPLHLPLGRIGWQMRIAVADTSAAHRQWLQAQYGPVCIFPMPAKFILAEIEYLFRTHWAGRAVRELAEHEPQFSASRVMTYGQGGAFVAIAAALSMSLFLVPRGAGLFLIVLSGIAFCMNAVFRAVLLWIGADETPISPEAPLVADGDLPIYSILVPLYREANVLPALLRALNALDYPGIR